MPFGFQLSFNKPHWHGGRTKCRDMQRSILAKGVLPRSLNNVALSWLSTQIHGHGPCCKSVLNCITSWQESWLESRKCWRQNPCHQDFQKLSGFKKTIRDHQEKLLVAHRKEKEVPQPLMTSQYYQKFGNAMHEFLSNMTSWQGAHRLWFKL